MLGPILPVQLLQQSQDLSFECLPHPPYSSDLAPPPHDFVFGPLKEAMEGKSFRSNEEVQQAVHKRLCSQPKSFFSNGIQALPNTGTLVWNAMETT
jgi:hypothetical protein